LLSQLYWLQIDSSLKIVKSNSFVTTDEFGMMPGNYRFDKLTDRFVRFDRLTERSTNRFDRGTDQNVGWSTDQNTDPSTDQNTDQNTDRGTDQNVGWSIDRDINRIPIGEPVEPVGVMIAYSYESTSRMVR
jgi:hypothetical protein